MAFYCGTDLGDLIVVSLNKYVCIFGTILVMNPKTMQCGRSNPCHYSLEEMRVGVHFSREGSKHILLISFKD